MPTAPTLIPQISDPPQTTDTVNFDARADDLLANDLPAAIDGMNAAASNVYANSVEAFNSAAAAASSVVTAAASVSAASSSAAAAAASAGATAWVSGATYAVGVRAISPTDAKVYRRIVAGAGTTSPTLDNVNWESAEPKGAPDFILQSFGLT